MSNEFNPTRPKDEGFEEVEDSRKRRAESGRSSSPGGKDLDEARNPTLVDRKKKPRPERNDDDSANTGDPVFLDERTEARRRYNRNSAALSRQRQKDLIKRLQHELDEATKKMDAVKKENVILEAQVRAWSDLNARMLAYVAQAGIPGSWQPGPGVPAPAVSVLPVRAFAQAPHVPVPQAVLQPHNPSQPQQGQLSANQLLLLLQSLPRGTSGVPTGVVGVQPPPQQQQQQAASSLLVQTAQSPPAPVAPAPAATHLHAPSAVAPPGMVPAAPPTDLNQAVAQLLDLLRQANNANAPKSD